MSGREAVWRDGERAAWETYRRRGYRLVARNWTSPLGEIDLVVARGDLLVFCEVKARTSSGLGGPHEAVNAAKQRRIRHLAAAFVASERPPVADFRFDVASVMVHDRGAPDVHLFEDAF